MPNDGWNTPPQQDQPGAFARPPQQQAPAQSMPLGDAVSQLSAPAPRPPEGDEFTLPPSVVQSAHWKGTPATFEEAEAAVDAVKRGEVRYAGDLSITIREPSSGDIERLYGSSTGGKELVDRLVAPKFITAIGGMPVRDYTEQQAWWARVSPKAQQLVARAVARMMMVTDDEENEFLASRRPAGRG